MSFKKRVAATHRLEVLWEDATLHTSGWQKVAAHVRGRKRVRVYSFGFPLANDKRGIVLASCIQGSNAAGVVTIPKRQIVKVRRVK